MSIILGKKWELDRKKRSKYLTAIYTSLFRKEKKIKIYLSFDETVCPRYIIIKSKDSEDSEEESETNIYPFSIEFGDNFIFMSMNFMYSAIDGMNYHIRVDFSKRQKNIQYAGLNVRNSGVRG